MTVSLSAHVSINGPCVRNVVKLRNYRVKITIQFYADINESHAATGFTGRTDLPAFHIFTIEETYPSTRRVMLPYRFSFYQIVLLEQSGDALLNMNTDALTGLSDSVSFASPQHVLAWVRGVAQRGFILYFKEEFLNPHLHPVEAHFPYFRLNATNFLAVGRDDKQLVRNHFCQLLEAFRNDHPYRVQLLQSLLPALLFECKRLYDAEGQLRQTADLAESIAFRFQQLVDQHFLTQKTVAAYADLLALSPDYLGQTVKAATGGTPSAFIAERVILEAKKLLLHTELSIAEIADYLGYSEPTHFTRFFRRHVDCTPRTWRRQHRT